MYQPSSMRVNPDFDARSMNIIILASRFNEEITNELLAGALDCLERHRARRQDIPVHRVPGALELPVTARKILETGNVDALLCFGAIIRGETPHFEIVARESSSGLSQVALESKIAVINGVLTTNTHEQAWERASRSEGNKGWESALAAMEMITLFRRIDQGERVTTKNRA